VTRKDMEGFSHNFKILAHHVLGGTQENLNKIRIADLQAEK
jgi:hypothetical protein